MSEVEVPRRVLVTGATGFIGSHLVALLMHQGIAVRTLGRHPLPGLDHIQADVREDFSAAATGCDCVVHLAGLADASASYEQPVEFARVNVIGTLNALEAARRNDAAFVLASSQRVYRPSVHPLSEEAIIAPVDPYGQSKAQAEQWTELYAHLYSVPSTILRLFSVYGPGQRAGQSSGVVSILLRNAREGQPLRVRARQVRDFVDVRDTVRAISLAIQRRPEGLAVYNIGTGRPTPIEELGEIIRSIVEVSSPIIVDVTPGAESYIADTRRAESELEFEAQIELYDGLVWYNQRFEAPQ